MEKRAAQEVGHQAVHLTAPLASRVSPQICPLEESLKSAQLIYLTPLVAAHHHRSQDKSQALSDLA